MGNNQGLHLQEKSEYGLIRVICTQSYYLADEPITGKVVLNMARDFPAKKLSVRFAGKETVAVFRKTRETVLANRTLTLAEAREAELTIPSGRHEYEFSLVPMPGENVASATKYKSSKAVCDVSYSLTALLESATPRVPSLGTVFDLLVLEKFKAICNKSVARKMAIHTDTKSYGTAAMVVRMDYTGILRQAGFEVYVDYDNMECSRQVKHILVRLRQFVSVSVDQKVKSLKEDRVVGQWRLASVPAGEKKFFNGKLMFPTVAGYEFLETCNGMNFHRSYALTAEPVYEGMRTDPKCAVELEVSLSNEFQSRKKLPVPVVEPVAEEKGEEAEDAKEEVKQGDAAAAEAKEEEEKKAEVPAVAVKKKAARGDGRNNSNNDAERPAEAPQREAMMI